MIVKDVCMEAKALADRKVSHQMESVKKVYVFLNPDANNRKASKHFRRYAEPILFSADVDVTVVTSVREGHIRKLMEFIHPTNTDAIIVAGGDGTLFEVVNGFVKHHDVETLGKIPIGIIPLGAENRFFRRMFPDQYSSKLPRRIGEAAGVALQPQSVKPASVIELQPAEGDKVYALSGMNWGAFKDAEENRNSFKFFGPLQLFLSYAQVSLRKWPENFVLHLWAPELPPSPSPSPSLLSQPSPSPNEQRTTAAATSSSAGLVSLEESSERHVASERISIPESLKVGTEKWMHMQTGTVALNFREHSSGLQGSYWTDRVDSTEFLKQGWKANRENLISHNLGGELLLDTPLQPHSLSLNECVMSIQGSKESWVSVDGEGFEAVPMRVKLLPKKLNIMCYESS